MELELTPEQQEQLAQIVGQTGRSPDDLAREAVDRYLADESQFLARVQVGLDAAERADFVPTSEVWARVERVLKG
jgi:predicted transcriptional regulator